MGESCRTVLYCGVLYALVCCVVRVHFIDPIEDCFGTLEWQSVGWI